MIEFNIFRIVQILLPFRRRTTRSIAWIKVFVSDLAAMGESLRQLWSQSVKEAKMTPQVCFLEHLLNDRYGRTDIFISDGYELGPWIYTDTETPNPEFFLDQADSFLWTDEDGITVDFVVNIPAILLSQASVIAAYVQKYKLCGKIFIIQVFS